MTSKGSPRGRATAARAQTSPPPATPTAPPEEAPPTVPTADEAAAAIADSTTSPVAAPVELPPVAPPEPEPLPLSIKHSTDVGVDLKPELHEGIVDAAGQPVDLATEFSRELVTGNLVYVQRRIFETYRLPGTQGGPPRLGLTLLLNAGTALPLEAADKLVKAQQKARAEKAKAAQSA